MNLKENLEWRYACKAMNGTSISDEKRNTILEAMRMAPTSLGVQPVKFYLVRNPEVKKDLTPIFNNQGQIEMSDSVVIIASRVKYTDEWLSHVVDNISTVRSLTAEKAEATMAGLKNYMAPIPEDYFSVWAMKQAYICLGFGLLSAADQRVDSTPMEGFDAEALNKYLKLDETEYQVAVTMVLGNRDAEHDYLVDQAKVRLPMSDMLVEV